MKQICQVFSNPIFTPRGNSEKFELVANLELVIVHTDGKEYSHSKDSLATKNKFNEQRFTVSPEMLQHLITDLQLHQKKLNNMRENSDKINSLVQYLDEQSIK